MSGLRHDDDATLRELLQPVVASADVSPSSDYEREFLAAVCNACASSDFEPLRAGVLSALADRGFTTS